MSFQRPVYPFSALVDQAELKLGLLLNAVNPMIGGLLIRGQKGTGKSTSVRALVDILPEIMVVKGCPFNCSLTDPTNMCPSCLEKYIKGEPLEAERRRMRIVSLPIGSTEDRVIGSLDIERAISQGIRALQPGLLAEANQNILYIDEVNLLPDHITDSILDAAASGWNTVEREGISVQHPSRFILVGTMNPEEGELRPQILDRFGVYAETRNIQDPDPRALVLRRNEEFTADPYSFISKHAGELEEIRSEITAARKLLPEVETPRKVYSAVAAVCSRLRVDGFRPDIVAVKAAKALAALHGRAAVTQGDVDLSVGMALGHRTRRSGMSPPPSPSEIMDALGKARRRLKIGREINLPGINGILHPPVGLLDSLLRDAFKGIISDVLTFVLLIFSITYLIEAMRSVMNLSSLNPLTLLIEVVIGGALSFLLIQLPWWRRREREDIGGLDLSKVTIEATGKLPPPDRWVRKRSSAGSANVRYRKHLTTPEYGRKILRPVEELHKMPRGVKPYRMRGPIKGGGGSGGRRIRAISSSSRGMYAWYRIPKGRPRDVALVPTLRAAALRQHGGEGRTAHLLIKPEDIRVKIREYHAPFSIILLVDMSMSMIQSMDNFIQAIYSLHGRVYSRRDRVGLIVFKGSRAFIIQHPTTNLPLVIEKLRRVGASDFTPMASGLLQAMKSLKQEMRRNRDAVPNLIVISDGIVNVPLDVPLSPLTRRRYMSEAQADSFDVARLMAKEGFRVFVVNTSHSEAEAKAFPAMEEGWRLRLTPTQFLIELARISGGGYRGLSFDGTQDM